jgi:hypothetical protein
MTAWSAGVICTIFGVFVGEREWGGKCLFCDGGFSCMWALFASALAVGCWRLLVLDVGPSWTFDLER